MAGSSNSIHGDASGGFLVLFVFRFIALLGASEFWMGICSPFRCPVQQ
jgi:hypothetical protein